MRTGSIISVDDLGFPWTAADPFLFCVHHEEAYPPGNDALGPNAVLTGRHLGNDFSAKDGWSMYHGDTVPGFPAHPHRGFETVTIARRGLIDHFDSMGASARYGAGDVQWLTAGSGILHSEMMPLIATDAANPSDIFQIWVNLPARSKLAAPHFSMLWAEDIPRFDFLDPDGRRSTVVCIAGKPLSWPWTGPGTAPPPDSWASQSDAGLAIWTVALDLGARLTLPPADVPGTRRTLYFFKGRELGVAGTGITRHAAIELRADEPTALVNGAEAAECLVLQGRPIGEPVAHYGPFVMNTEAEIRQTMNDYRRTQFGGWPWPQSDPVNPREARRFARHADGRVDRPRSS